MTSEVVPSLTRDLATAPRRPYGDPGGVRRDDEEFAGTTKRGSDDDGAGLCRKLLLQR